MLTLKHAGPARARVVIGYDDSQVTIAVVDDGRGGMDPSNAQAGHGLVGMRERVALYGGKVEAGPDGGRGFAVRVTLPIPQAVGG